MSSVLSQRAWKSPSSLQSRLTVQTGMAL